MMPAVRPTLEDRLARGPAWVWVAAALCLLAIQIKWWWIPGRDALSYLSIARGMTGGELARLGSPHLRYAPGYPFLIAPAFWVSGRPFLTLALLQFVFGAAAIAGVYAWTRRIVAPASGGTVDETTATVAATAAALLVAFTFLNVNFWHYYQQALSETAFLAVLMAAALALQRLVDVRGVARTVGWVIAAVLLTVLAASIRQVGVFLVGGFGLALLASAVTRRDRWIRVVAVGLGVGLPVGAALLALVTWDHAIAEQVAAGKSYAEYMADESLTMTQQLAEGLRLRISETGRLLIPGMFRAYARSGEWLHVNVFIYAGVSLLVAAGWWKLVCRRRDVLLLTAPIYVAFFIYWPFDQGTRYMLPLLPVLAVCLWRLGARFERHRLSVLLILVIGHAAIAAGDWIRTLSFREFDERWPQMDELAEELETRQGRVEYAGVDRDLALMLSLASDRSIEPAAGDGAGAAWLVTPAGADPPAGMASRLVVDDLALLAAVDRSSDSNDSDP